MSPLKKITTMLAICLLTGCKLVVIANTGGEVQSSSNQRNCAEGKTCKFDVRDLSFADLFTAVAKPGYRFVRWKLRRRGLCGGNSTPCQLSTAGLASRPDLVAILETDEEFYLEAIFEKTGGSPAVGSRNASACFNNRLVEQGATMELKLESSGGDFGGKTVSELTQTIVGPARFRGRNALEAESEVRVEEDGTQITAPATTYLVAQKNKKRVLALGGSGETYADGVLVGAVDTVYDPHLLTRFDLKPGQSYTQEFTVRSTSMVGGQELVDVSENKVVTRYVGVVPVTVPAGDFDACEFESTSSFSIGGAGFSESSREWFAVGSGILLKEESSGGSSVLLSGKIDGKSIR